MWHIYFFLACFCLSCKVLFPALLKMTEIVEYSEWAPCLPHIRMLLTSKYVLVFRIMHGVNCALELYHWFGVLGHVPLLVVVVGHYSVAIQLYVEMNVDFKHSCINRCIISISASTNACLKEKLLIMCVFTVWVTGLDPDGGSWKVDGTTV